MTEEPSPPGRLIDVVGFRLHLNCSGGKGPVILLDAGLGDSCLVWADIQPQLAKNSRVCSYDRAGVGWSDPGPTPRSFQTAAEELHTLLKRAGEQGPYVLVGHSAGVNTMRLFAHSYPDEVAGLVLIEPPILTGASSLVMGILKSMRRFVRLLAKWGVISYLGRTSRIRLLYAGSEPPRQVADLAGFLYRPQSVLASMREIDGLPETIRLLDESTYPGAWRDWPVVIISAYKRRKPSNAKLATLHSLAEMSSRGRLVQVKSSHFVHFDRPELVVSCIQDVLSDIRDRG